MRYRVMVHHTTPPHYTMHTHAPPTLCRLRGAWVAPTATIDSSRDEWSETGGRGGCGGGGRAIPTVKADRDAIQGRIRCVAKRLAPGFICTTGSETVLLLLLSLPTLSFRFFYFSFLCVNVSACPFVVCVRARVFFLIEWCCLHFYAKRIRQFRAIEVHLEREKPYFCGWA